MRFQISGLPPAPFAPLFALDDAALAAMFSAPETAYIHLHHARFGCDLAAVTRA